MEIFEIILSVKELKENILFSSPEGENRVSFYSEAQKNFLHFQASFLFQLLEYCCLRIFLSSPRSILANKQTNIQNQNVSSKPDINSNIHISEIIIMYFIPASLCTSSQWSWLTPSCKLRQSLSSLLWVRIIWETSEQYWLISGSYPRLITGNF